MKKLIILIVVLIAQNLYAQSNIVSFEYFFIEVSSGDTLPDPSSTSGVFSVPVSPANDVTVNINIGLSLLDPNEDHHLHLYAIDANGTRSLQYIDTTSLPASPFTEKRVAANVFLQGPYDANGDTMSTNLNPSGGPLQIPLTSPYAEDPRTVSSIPADIVDWVLVELRETATGSAVADTSAFLHKDGGLVADDGITKEVTLKTTSAANDFFVVIKHRNHLSIMTSSAISLSDIFSITYDFTTAQSQAFGSNPMTLLEAGVFGMLSGDGNADGGVDALDINLEWRPQNGTTWNYTKLADFNLDGGIDAIDVNLYWRPNNGTATQVP